MQRRTASRNCPAIPGQEDSIPYRSIADLPPAVRTHLPLHAQEIFRAAFNNAWDSHADNDPDIREQVAFRIAWAAVKRSHRKQGDFWVPRD